MAKDKDPDPVVVPPVVEAPAERIVRILPVPDLAKIEKEIQGLNAKLRWPHISESLKDVYRLRVKALQEKLGDAG